MHWSGDVTLGTLIGACLLVITTGGIMLRLGRLQAVLEQLVQSAKDVKSDLVIHEQKLEIHQEHDNILFREMTATLNQIVGKLYKNAL